jgi:hypothetical protein
MAGFTPVAGQLNYAQPDWVGGLQSQRRNAMADQQFAATQNQNQQGLDLRRNAFALDQQKFDAEQQQQQSQQRSQAIQQIGSLAQRISAEPPEQQRQVTASIIQNPAYQPLFKAAGIDATQLDVNSPDFVQHLKTWASLAPERAPTIVPKGSTVLDPNTHKPLYQSGPEEITPYQNAQLDIERKRLAAESGRANKPQLVTVDNPDGTKTQKWVQPGQTEGPALGPPSQKPMGEADKKNAVLFDSMMNAEKQIQALEKQPGGATDTSSKWNAFLGGLPVVGGAAKVAQTDEFRKYESAGLRWAANLLYLKSGATANPDEIRSTWKQFFPQPGDGPAVKTQKEAARAQEIESTRKYMVPGAAPLPAAATGGPPPNIAALLDKYK